MSPLDYYAGLCRGGGPGRRSDPTIGRRLASHNVGSPKWTAARYKEAVKGSAETYGLRRVAIRFDAASGYDLRKINEWTPAMKRRIREYDKRLAILTKQPTVPKYIRDPKKLRMAQEHFHRDVPSRGFKVALVPDYGQTIEKLDKRTGEIKRVKVPPRLTFRDDGSIRVRWNSYDREFQPFNQRALVRDPETEIRRAIRGMPGARQFFAAIGGDEDEPEGMLQGVTMAGDSRTFINKIMAAMHRYDGVHAIREGNHKGENPANHNWRHWLRGVFGYVVRDTGVSPRDLSKVITERRNENKRIRQQGVLWDVFKQNRIVGSVRAKSEGAALKLAKAQFGKGVTVQQA